MAVLAPLALLLDGQEVGRICSFGYDTPWGHGLLEAASGPAALLREVSALLVDLEGWPELPLELDDARWAAALADRGLTAADVDGWHGRSWSLRGADGAEWPITLVEMDRRGFLTWRF